VANAEPRSLLKVRVVGYQQIMGLQRSVGRRCWHVRPGVGRAHREVGVRRKASSAMAMVSSMSASV